MDLPLRIYLSPLIPANCVDALREAAKLKPKYFSLVDGEAGALCVVPEFDTEAFHVLQARKRRIIGLPFMEKLLKDVHVLSTVKALPLYDLILPPDCEICCSRLTPVQKERCENLAKWMGAEFEEKITPKTMYFVTDQVTVNRKSKYQEALHQAVPILPLGFLEETWRQKRQLDPLPRALPSLQGLNICFDPLNKGAIDRLRIAAVACGAQTQDLDNAEVVIVSDTTNPLYAEAQRRGVAAAPPRWLEQCLASKKCLPVVGDLTVSAPQTRALGGSLVAFDGSSAGRKSVEIFLMHCVICLRYMPSNKREMAKDLAWDCGAYTTADPLDSQITHVLFPSEARGGKPPSVKMPTDQPDRLAFVTISWLDACKREGRRVNEDRFRLAANYDPQGDRVYDLQSDPILPAVPSMPALPPPMSVDRPPLPSPQVQHETPVSSEPQRLEPANGTEPGVFGGKTCGLVGFQGDELRRLAKMICGSGGAVVQDENGGMQSCNPLWDQLDYCVLRDGTPRPPLSVPLASAAWVRACVKDATLHHIHASPHFEPCRVPLPIIGMEVCSVRVTAIAKNESWRRSRLEELASVLGTKVAGGDSKWSDVTHLICVDPSLLDMKVSESACKRSIPIVSPDWLIACFTQHGRQSEERYRITGPAIQSRSQEIQATQPAVSDPFACGLSGYDICISPSVLGSDPGLPGMALKLGAQVHQWQNIDELKRAMASAKGQLVLLLDEEEAACDDASLPKDSCVTASWLTETFDQRRPLPLESFKVHNWASPGRSAQKRRVSCVREPTYAWQSDATAQLERVAEESRVEEKERKKQRMQSEGLRLMRAGANGAS